MEEQTKTGEDSEGFELASHVYLEALSTIVGASLKYFSLVRKDDRDCYVCLGEHNMYFIDERLDEIDSIVPYDNVHGINGSEKKQKGVLQKESSIIICTDSPKEFLKCFQLYWQTDKMFRLNKFDTFMVNMVPIIKSKGSAVKSKIKKIPQELTQIPTDEKVIYKRKGFKWWIKDKEYEKIEETQKYITYTKESDQSKVTIHVTDVYPIENLKHMEFHREDLEEFTWYYVEKYVYNDTRGSDVWIFNSNPYFKKTNLIADKASWEGWEIHGSTYEFDYFVTVQRRMFIPPTMDSFSDVICISKFPKSKNDNQLNTPKIKDKEKEKEKEKPEDKIKANASTHRKFCETIVPSKIDQKVYKTLLQKRADALLLNSDELNFFRYNLSIEPKLMKYGYYYLDAIIEQVSGAKGTSELKDIARLMNNKKNMYLKDKENASDKELKSLDSIVSKFEKELKIDQDLKAENELKETKDAQDDANTAKDELQSLSNIWRTKVCNFLAYCVDGGILISKFTIVRLIDIVTGESGESKTKSEMMIKELVYLLQCRKTDSPIPKRGARDLGVVLKLMIEDEGEYTFNEQVMVAIIEYGLAQKALESQSEMAYHSFIEYILSRTSSEELKMCICRVIIKLFGGDSQGLGYNVWDESKRISIQRIVHPIVESYKTGKRPLKELCIDALFNMGKSNDEYLQVTASTPIYSFIIDNLASSHQPLLFKSLRFFLLMIKWDSKLDLLLKENNDLILKIMKCICSKDRESHTFKATQIKGAEYNIEIKIYVMKILFMFIKKVGESKYKFSISSVENSDSFIKDLAGELDKIHGQRYDPKDLGSISNDDNPVRKMNESEKTYCKTILSFLIQFSKDDSKHKVWIAKIIIIPVIKMLFEQLSRVEQEFTEEVSKNPKATITEEMWIKGPFEDDEIEFKYFKLIRSVFINVEDVQINEVKEQIQRMTPKVIRRADCEFGGIFQIYLENCPREKIKKSCKAITK